MALLLAVPIAGCSLSAPQGGQQEEEQLPEEEKEGQEEPGEKDASVLKTVMTASPEEYLKVPDPASLSFAAVPQRQVSEKEVEEEYRYYRDNAVFLTDVNDRDTVQKGDVVNIDYKETAEGEEYPEASGFNYEIGGGMFSSGFDDQLIGMKTGETKTFSFSYPDDYYAENLRGRETTFEVTLNSIMAYDTPEFNDETIARFGLIMDDGTKVDSEETLRAYLRAGIEKEYREEYEDARRSKAIMALTEASEQIKDYPDAMMDETADYLAASIGMPDGDMDEETRSALMEYTQEIIREMLCVNLVADSQGISVSDSDIIGLLRAQYGSEAEDIFDQADEKAVFSYRTSLRRERVADYILSVAQVEETEGERQAGTAEQQKNAFNRFKQNEYDFDELEKEILGN